MVIEFGWMVSGNGIWGMDYGIGGVVFVFGGVVFGGYVIVEWLGLRL